MSALIACLRNKYAIASQLALIAVATAACTTASTSDQPATASRTDHRVSHAHRTHAAQHKSVHRSSTHRSKRRKRHSRASDGSWIMPNEVGRGLQAAQDDIQRVSSDQIFVSHSHDLLGDRFQILDSDWKVCTQNVSPGTRVSAIAHIDFGVVKLDESCP